MTILLIFAIVMMILEARGISTDLFVSVETRKEKFIKQMEELEESNNKELFLVLISLIYTMYILFYITSMIYINSFIFAVISILLILFTLRHIYHSILYTSKPESCKPRTIVKRVIICLIEYSYLLYVMYWIYSHF